MSDSNKTIVQLFGLRINALHFDDAVASLANAVTSRPPKVVVTPNVDHLVSLDENPAVKSVYATADYLFADGMPVVWASKLLGQALPERVTGADLFVALCDEAVTRGWRVAAIGGTPGQEAGLLAQMAARFPGIQLSIHSPRMGFDYQGADGLAAVQWVNALKPDLVFVCLGFPRQSLWSITHRQNLDAGLVLCVGAAMEFALGMRSRSPVWMQRIGFEWLWRLLSEPSKLWRRYLVRGPRFLKIVWAEWRTPPNKKA